MAEKKRRRNHIYPGGALSAWERDGVVAVRLGGEPEPTFTSVRNAAVRTAFYWATLPDGTRVDDAERTLEQVENQALPLIRAIGDIWPLDTRDKARVAELLGLQLMRVPAWMSWHDTHSDRSLADRAEQDLFSQGGVLLPQTLVRQMTAAVNEHAKSDRFRLNRMFALAPKVASLFASMHWTLIEFEHPLLATSDQPVVAWPLAEQLMLPGPIPPQGLIETLEVRVPLEPNRALLMTWDEGTDLRVLGTPEQAARINAFTVASADKQWFHQPGTQIELHSGRQGPVSLTVTELNYDSTAAVRSERRRELSDWVQPYLGSDDMDEIRSVASRPVTESG